MMEALYQKKHKVSTKLYESVQRIWDSHMILSHKKVEKIKQLHVKSWNRLHQPALLSILGLLKLNVILLLD